METAVCATARLNLSVAVSPQGPGAAPSQDMGHSFLLKVGGAGRVACRVVLPWPPEGQARVTAWCGEGEGCPQEQECLCVALSRRCSAHLSPEVRVVLGTNLCSVCRSEHANPSDMRRSCSVERKERAQDQLTRTALPPGLTLKPIVLVLPV